MSNPTQQAAKAKTAAIPKELTGKERRVLRALGHALSPVVQIGKAGLTPGVTQELQGALDAHELIKVQILGECPLERPEAAERITVATKAALVQSLGRMLLFYRAHPEKPRISLDPSKAVAMSPPESPARAATRRRPAGGTRRAPAGRSTRRQFPSRGNKT